MGWAIHSFGISGLHLCFAPFLSFTSLCLVFSLSYSAYKNKCFHGKAVDPPQKRKVGSVGPVGKFRGSGFVKWSEPNGSAQGTGPSSWTPAAPKSTGGTPAEGADCHADGGSGVPHGGSGSGRLDGPVFFWGFGWGDSSGSPSNFQVWESFFRTLLFPVLDPPKVAVSRHTTSTGIIFLKGKSGDPCFFGAWTWQS